MERTVHILREDITSQAHAFRDKRKEPTWYEKEVIPAGTRLVLVKTIDAYTGVLVNNFSVYRDSSRDHTEPSDNGRDELRLFTQNLTTGKIRWRFEDSEWDTKKDKVFNAAYRDLCEKVWKSLGEATRDFRTTFMVPGTWRTRGTAEVLYNLYAKGKITLEDLEQAAKEEDDADIAQQDKEDAERLAKKGKGD